MAADAGPGALVHRLRQIYANLIVDNGASLPKVQQLRGYVDLSTTQAHIVVTGKGQEEAVLTNPARHLPQHSTPSPTSPDLTWTPLV